MLSQVERGETSPTLTVAARIAAGLELRLSQLLRLDEAGTVHGRRADRAYTLSIAAADGPFVSGIDIAAVSPYVDWFNLMTYDFVNGMTPATGHHTGLDASAPNCSTPCGRASNKSGNGEPGGYPPPARPGYFAGAGLWAGSIPFE